MKIYDNVLVGISYLNFQMKNVLKVIDLKIVVLESDFDGSENYLVNVRNVTSLKNKDVSLNEKKIMNEIGRE